MKETMNRREFLKTAAVGSIAVASIASLGTTLAAPASANEQADRVRWDIFSIEFATGTVNAGGVASARAEDGSRISLTGSGTFVAPGGRISGAVTGGGTWRTFSAEGAVIGSGTYEVTGLGRWEVAPGAFPPLTDNISDPADARAGLVVLRVAYSDGSEGVLVVSCHLVGTPDSVFEGVTASKGFVDYWNREAPIAGVDANRTLFHIRH